MSVAELLDHPEVRAQVSPITVAQYHGFPEFNERGRRTELIRGVILEKMPETPLHASIAKLLYDDFLTSAPEGFSVRQDQPITLRESEPEPDVAVVRGWPRQFWREHPNTAALVVEVAVTSVGLDREKASLYAEAGVEEYWIMLAREQMVEVYRHPVNGLYTERQAASSGRVFCEKLPILVIDLDELFASGE